MRDDELGDVPSITGMLELVRAHLGMDVAFVGRVIEGRREFRAVAADRPEDRSLSDRSDPLEASYCRLVLDGTLEPVVPDAATQPALAAMPITDRLGIRAYMGVPITLPDGQVYGTLCCFSRTPQPTLAQQQATLLRFVADVISERLAVEEEERSAQHAVQRAVADALRDGQPRMVFQPIVRLCDGVIVGYEALARFAAEPVRPPDRWFADAGGAGIGPRLEARAIERAVEVLPSISSTTTRLSVNVSGAALLSHEVASTLDDAPLDRLVIEVTEHERHIDIDRLSDRLAVLRSEGARIALDDVGAGYAGLERVVRLTPDRMKLDRALVAQVDRDPLRQAMVSATVAFADAIGIEIVAEGIETAAEHRAVADLGVALGQGHHLGAPSPLGEHGAS